MSTAERSSIAAAPASSGGPTFASAAVFLLVLVSALVAISAGDRLDTQPSQAAALPAGAQAGQWYASPRGQADGDGTIAQPLDLATAISAGSPAQPGDTIWLRGGVYAGAFTSELTGTDAAPIVVRQYPGERAIIDGRDAPANTLTIRGAYSWYWGFEVTNSDPVRVYHRQVNLDPDGPDRVRGVGVNIFGPGTKCINLIVHDALGGFGMWESAVDAEIYGSLTYYNGVVDAVRGHGHGIYIQNRQGIKRIEDVIAFGNHATGMKAYGESGYAEGVHFEGVVSFNNGVPSLTATHLDKIENLFVGTTDHPADRISLVDNMFYHLPQVLGPNVTLGYQNPDNGTLTVQDNWIMGGSIALSVRHWRKTTVTGNTLYATTSGNRNSDQSLVHLMQPRSATSLWENNTYVDSTEQAHPFTFNEMVNGSGSGNLAYPDWQELSTMDANSTYRAGRPTGATVLVRPNRYEAGRAHLVIYNWDGVSTLPVDLARAGLAAGEPFEIRDSQNYFGAPVMQGHYTGAPVSVPLTSRRVAQPVGNPLLPSVHTSPDFFVFVVASLKQRTVLPNLPPRSGPERAHREMTRAQ